MPGGDLLSLTFNLHSFSEQDTRFYVAEMVLAVGWLHEMDFIHRYVSYGVITKIEI